jgi:hypothetical protein
MPDKPSPEKFGAKSCILCDANSPSFFRFCLSKAQLVASRNVAFFALSPLPGTARRLHAQAPAPTPRSGQSHRSETGV